MSQSFKNKNYKETNTNNRKKKFGIIGIHGIEEHSQDTSKVRESEKDI